MNKTMTMRMTAMWVEAGCDWHWGGGTRTMIRSRGRRKTRGGDNGGGGGLFDNDKDDNNDRGGGKRGIGSPDSGFVDSDVVFAQSSTSLQDKDKDQFEGEEEDAWG